MASKHLTAADICVGLRKRYIAPEWALLFNVANGTGARQYRYADAIGMSLYPSRGLEIHGFEVKISKSDWKREAADPEKAETIAAYCDRWWVVTLVSIFWRMRTSRRIGDGCPMTGEHSRQKSRLRRPMPKQSIGTSWPHSCAAPAKPMKD